MRSKPYPTFLCRIPSLPRTRPAPHRGLIDNSRRTPFSDSSPSSPARACYSTFKLRTFRWQQYA
jgi:hypothetical protein